MKLKTGDKVLIIAGKNKGKEGKIIKTIKEDNKVVVEGVNIVKRHIKPSAQNQEGGILEKEAPLHASNVMIIDPKSKKGTRIAHEIDSKSGKKIRIATKTKEKLD